VQVAQPTWRSITDRHVEDDPEFRHLLYPIAPFCKRPSEIKEKGKNISFYVDFQDEMTRQIQLESLKMNEHFTEGASHESSDLRSLFCPART
jgi:hypothetical protein